MIFRYNGSMYKIGWISFVICSLVFPLAIHAADGYIGENPGFDFYSKIDEWNYKILEKTVNRRLRETPTMDQFGKDCTNAETLLQWIPTTSAMLDDVEKWDYGGFYDKLLQNTKNNPNGPTLSTDTFPSMAKCITSAYKDLKDRAKWEQNARETISYIGLYMDGDKNNSEYDIVSDIEKINSILFSQEIKYTGTANQSGKWLSNFLSNRTIAPLFTISSLPNTTSATTSGNPSIPSTVTGGINAVSATPTLNLASIIGWSCGDTSALWPIDTLMDTGFATELQAALQAGVWENIRIASAGYTPSVGQARWLSGATASSSGALTSGSDFFHTMPCTSIFCIKTQMIPGSSNLLGGGKNISIEGILDKHAKILYPISESALWCQVMTNNAGSSPIKNLNLAKTIAWLKVYLGSKPQTTRRDKRETSPERDEEDLKDIQNCGYASAGLSTDTARANSIGWAGFKWTRWATTETASNVNSPLWPQEVAEMSRYTDCIDSHARTGRKTYYDSFSTDVTEIQAYTVGMLDEITSIMSNLTAMNSKPLECKQ